MMTNAGTLVLLILCSLISLHQLLPSHSQLVQAQTTIAPRKSKRIASQNVRADLGPPRKKHITIATVEVPPFMMKKFSDKNDGTFEWYGYCIDFFNELVKHLPYELTFDIYQVADNKFGGLVRETVPNVQNGRNMGFKKIEKWTGLLGDLHEGKAQLALAPLAVMAERELAIDFTVPFYDLVGIQILIKRPDVPNDWFEFLTMFDQEVWLSLLIVYFVTAFVMFLFDRLSPYSHKNISILKKPKKNRKLQNTSDHNQIDSNKFKKTPIENSKGKNVPTHDPSALVAHNSDSSKKMPSVFFMSGNQRAPANLNNPLPSTRLNSSLRNYSHNPSDNFKSLRFNDIVEEPSEMKEVIPATGTEKEPYVPDFGLRESFWFCITSLTPQGGGEAPQNLSGRVVAGAWWLFCFIVIASYTANLAAFLTVSRLDIPIESLDDLSKQYQIKYAPVDGSAERTYFERMANIEEMLYNVWKDMSLNNSLSKEERTRFAVWDYPISDKYTRIWAQIQQVGMPLDVDSGINRVKNSSLEHGFALLTDANTVRYAVMTDCTLRAAGEEFSRKPISLGVQKGEERFRDDLSYAILQLINERFMEILRERWWTNNPNRMICDHDEESEGIRIENIVGVFIIIFAGVGIAFIVWGIERIMYRIKLGASQDLIRKL